MLHDLLMVGLGIIIGHFWDKLLPVVVTLVNFVKGLLNKNNTPPTGTV